MRFQEEVSLANYSTMALGGKASFLTRVTTPAELEAALNFAKSKSIPSLIIGSGSNIIWRDQGFKGLVIVSDIKGFELHWQTSTTCLVKIGSGEVWDEVVSRSVDQGLSGIEALSLIPGKAGATPVQNVGAYGQEIADTLIELEAYDNKHERFVKLTNKDCNFGYRTSCFKTSEKGRFYITSLTLNLTKANPKPPSYAALSRYLNEHNITEYTPQIIRQAVIDIRYQKLPDPKLIHNSGSFFANPIISSVQFENLKQSYPNIPSWPVDGDKIKLSAAWLIEQAGFKDYHDVATGMATWPTQPLVLVNEQARSTDDLIIFRNKIISKIKDMFDIDFAQEPELLP